MLQCEGRKKKPHTHTRMYMHTLSDLLVLSLPASDSLLAGGDITLSLQLPASPYHPPSPLCFWTIPLLSPLYLHCPAQYWSDQVDEEEIQSSGEMMVLQ